MKVCNRFILFLNINVSQKNNVGLPLSIMLSSDLLEILKSYIDIFLRGNIFDSFFIFRFKER